LTYAADTQDANVAALRSLSGVQREDARTYRIREQGRTQIEVANYRAALTDARQEIKRELRSEQQQPTQPSWAMDDDEDEAGSFRWMQ
jgi:hypothetical protein